MVKYKKYTFSVPLNDSCMERFDNLRGPVDRSQAIRTVIQFLMSYDPNYIRNILGLPEFASSPEVVENAVQA